ncbi:inositol-pentakisphosphate 2-kinase [Phakopsora pachyrhizi]|nr:inositol-pentakisphosphate 2-kinase [Phakopsora pachyrhizi]
MGQMKPTRDAQPNLFWVERFLNRMESSTRLDDEEDYLVPLEDEALRRTEPKDWVYLGQGSANIILAYHPAPQLSSSVQINSEELLLQNRSIRLSKLKKITSSSATSRDKKHPISFIDFQERFIRRLIDERFLLKYQDVRLDSTWLKALVKNFKLSSSSCDRSHEDCSSPKDLFSFDVDLDSDFGLVTENLRNFGNNHLITIEIKDCITWIKQNFNKYYLSSNRFCSLQLFSNNSNDDKSNNNRNPGDKQLRKGIQKLYEEWKSEKHCSEGRIEDLSDSLKRPSQVHNNFRVFKSQKELLSREDMENLFDASLLKKPQQQDQEDPQTNLLPEEEVIDNDPMTIRDLQDILQILQKSSECPIEDFKNSVYDKLSLRLRVKMFKLSMTFKDCSIIINFPPNSRPSLILPDDADIAIANKPNSNAVEDQLNNNHKKMRSNDLDGSFSIKIIDLDLKDSKRLEEFVEKDKNLFQTFETILRQFEYPFNNNDVGLRELKCIKTCLQVS